MTEGEKIRSWILPRPDLGALIPFPGITTKGVKVQKGVKEQVILAVGLVVGGSQLLIHAHIAN